MLPPPPVGERVCAMEWDILGMCVISTGGVDAGALCALV